MHVFNSILFFIAEVYQWAKEDIYVVVSFAGVILALMIGLYWVVLSRTAGIDILRLQQGSQNTISSRDIDAIVSAKISPINNSIASISAGIASLKSNIADTLPKKAAEAAVAAVERSQQDLHQKYTVCQADLLACRTNTTRLEKQLSEVLVRNSELDNSNSNLMHSKRQAETIVEQLNADLAFQQQQVTQFRAELQECQKTLETIRLELSATQATSLSVQAELAKTFSNFIPTSVSNDSDLLRQIKSLHAESLAGIVSASNAWATWCSFAAADADAASKEYLLHELRRLGVVLINYWKLQSGSTPKDRYEKLSYWAKCLNEHSQGRYSLLIPQLGSPVNKNTMSMAGSSPNVQEVLCWQVRNSTGVTFSPAEVA
jgi:hypothetical protein